MRVLFLSQIVPYPPKGGVLQRGFNILRELSRHAEIDLLAFVHPDELQTPEAIEEGRTALAAFCRSVEFFPLWAKQSMMHRAAALGIGVASSQPFSTVAHRSGGFTRATSKRLPHADVLHVDTIGLHPLAKRELHSVPSVLTHHNIESLLMKRRAEFETNRVARWVLTHEARKLRRYESTVSQAYQFNVVMSDADEQALQRLSPGVKTAVIPNGVDIEYFGVQPDPQAATLIYAGGMNMFANRDAVLYFLREIWPLITARVPVAQFLVVGQNPPAELVDIAKRDRRVVVTGKVPDIRSYIGRASVYVVPLRVGGGTRLKVLDAMASGKALVSTSIGCEGLEVVANEHLLIADEPTSFAAAVVALLQNPWQRTNLGRTARLLAEQRYAWPIMGAQLVSTYREAIEIFNQSRPTGLPTLVSAGRG